jgi:hypothetical protein
MLITFIVVAVVVIVAVGVYVACYRAPGRTPPEQSPPPDPKAPEDRDETWDPRERYDETTPPGVDPDARGSPKGPADDSGRPAAARYTECSGGTTSFGFRGRRDVPSKEGRSPSASRPCVSRRLDRSGGRPHRHDPRGLACPRWPRSRQRLM